jgi:hypothetical protein
MFARFEQFLVRNGAIRQKQIPYYVKWVTNLYAAYKSPADKILTGVQKKSLFIGLKTLVKIGKSSKLNRHYGYTLSLIRDSAEALSQQVMKESNGME